MSSSGGNRLFEERQNGLHLAFQRPRRVNHYHARSGHAALIGIWRDTEFNL
ncbi:Uncharacterised protein [Vibrio cholerae]|uniref:Uncharacterized protein n=1 Tax=Vibrio cholerae TaxID=666 RepID=A0A655YPU4_VIBCL|nr:Uncharacterised protein [Vibrio cholerae]